MKKVIVPEGMLKAAMEWPREPITGMPLLTGATENAVRPMLEAALRWLSENPIVPTDEQIKKLFDENQYGVSMAAWKTYFCEWQRRMFLAPSPVIPEEIKDLLLVDAATFELPDGTKYPGSAASHNIAVIEAFKRGQQDIRNRTVGPPGMRCEIPAKGFDQWFKKKEPEK